MCQNGKRCALRVAGILPSRAAAARLHICKRGHTIGGSAGRTRRRAGMPATAKSMQRTGFRGCRRVTGSRHVTCSRSRRPLSTTGNLWPQHHRVRPHAPLTMSGVFTTRSRPACRRCLPDSNRKTRKPRRTAGGRDRRRVAGPFALARPVVRLSLVPPRGRLHDSAPLFAHGTPAVPALYPANPC